MTRTQLRPAQAAAITGVFVLLAGFGIMSLLSATGDWEVGRSMWHYRAATWGDALIVPMLCAILAAGLVDEHIPRLPHERRQALAGGSVFAIAGALVQASWLASARPIFNWTLPAAHHFSLPGWYHAIYLVIIAGAIGAAVAVLAIRVRHLDASDQTRVAGLPSTAALLGVGMSFGVMLAFDSTDSIKTSAGAGSTAGAGASVLVTVALAMLVLGPRRSVRPIIGGLVIIAVLTGLSILTHGAPR